MIDFLCGTITWSDGHQLTIEVNHIGYKCFMICSHLHPTPTIVKIVIHEEVQVHQRNWFACCSYQERDLLQACLGIRQVGYKVATTLLRSHNYSSIIQAIKQYQIELFLNLKIAQWSPKKGLNLLNGLFKHYVQNQPPLLTESIMEALLQLGYTTPEITHALHQTTFCSNQTAYVKAIIKNLKHLEIGYVSN